MVQAYADGKIELEKPKAGAKGGGNKLRLAPSFRQTHAFNEAKSVPNAKPYNAESIAKFLGWTTPKGQAWRGLNDRRYCPSVFPKPSCNHRSAFHPLFLGLSPSSARAIDVDPFPPILTTTVSSVSRPPQASRLGSFPVAVFLGCNRDESAGTT